MIKRLRPKWSDEELKQIYAAPHNHFIYGRGHGERVDKTIELVKEHITVNSVADLSCGNGHIAKSIGAETVILGDFAPGYPIEGPIEETIDLIPTVDAFVLSETLEHLDDPAFILNKINEKALALILTTPIDNWDDSNGEHYWSWDQEGVESLLDDTGWRVFAFDYVDSREYGEPYKYGIWLATSV